MADLPLTATRHQNRRPMLRTIGFVLRPAWALPLSSWRKPTSAISVKRPAISIQANVRTVSGRAVLREGSKLIRKGCADNTVYCEAECLGQVNQNRGRLRPDQGCRDEQGVFPRVFGHGADEIGETGVIGPSAPAAHLVLHQRTSSMPYQVVADLLKGYQSGTFIRGT